MANLISRLRGQRAITSINDYVHAVGQSMSPYLPASVPVATSHGTLAVEKVGSGYESYAKNGYAANGVVFSCMTTRQLVFSAARFRWQRIADGKPSDSFGTKDLAILERPWVGGTTQDLLSRMIQDADLAGNSYWARTQDELIWLRPDWVDIVLGVREFRGGTLGWKLLGYVYTEGGSHSGNASVPLFADEVCHFAPIPDPLATFRGMSWLTPVVREIENDGLMARHKRRFFENGATPNMIIKHPAGADRDKVLDFQKRLDATNAGVDNAYKTLNLYPGADATVVGANMQQIDFKLVQGAGETRIAAAAGVPPVIVGLSEGLQAATYSNYAQARRRFGDGTIHPLWQNVAGSLATLLPDLGSGVRLWYDADNVPFLREDEKDAAEIQSTQAQTIRTYVDGGYTPESAVLAVESGDLRVLKHTGLFSVQLQAPGAAQAAIEAPTEGANS